MAGKSRGLVERDGRYYARLVVPVPLRSLVGKTELREPLGPDRRTALRKLPGALDRFHAQIERARRQAPITVRPPSDGALMRAIYEEELRLDEAERDFRHSELIGPQTDFDRLHGAYAPPKKDRAFRHELFTPGRKRALLRVASGDAGDYEIQALVGWRVDDIRTSGLRDVVFGSKEWRSLARQFAAVELEVIDRATERDRGDYGGEPRLTILKASAKDDTPVSLKGLLERYGAELAKSGRGEAAMRRWRPCFVSLVEFIGHDDAKRLGKDDVIRWKGALLETLSAKTIRDCHLAGLKAVLNHAVEDAILSENVAAAAKQRVAKKLKTRERGFTDAEALAILKAAAEHKKSEREGEKLAAAKRWVPWLQALTGARIAEICQLRKQDFNFNGEIPSVRLTPEAGSIKTGEVRTIPLHKQLIERGLKSFVEEASGGALFFDDSVKRKEGATHPSKIVAGRVSEWIRSLKIVPSNVQPTHGWRHRMKTVGRDIAADPHIIDAIQGHAARTAGENYGDNSLKAMKRAIDLLPSYQV
jgi:integrase